MSDDLLKRLETPIGFQDLPVIQQEAATRIRELEAERDALRQELDGVLKMIGSTNE